MENPRELISKLNYVLTSRRLKSTEVIEEFLPIPTTRKEEQDTVTDMLYLYLKKKFVGCKVRTRANSIAIRMDGRIHLQAEKMRKDIVQNTDWMRWLEQNHRQLHRDLNNNRDVFSHTFQKREVDGRQVLYLSHQLDRIPGYAQQGLLRLLTSIDQEYEREESFANHYEQVITLIERETTRREEERRQRLTAELTAYQDSIKSRLMRPATSLANDRSTVSGKLRTKLNTWANEKGMANAYYAEEPTFDNVVPLETKVRVMHAIGSKEENWYAVPIFDDKYTVPEGHTVEEGWGRVKKHSITDERSKGGTAPLVVENYIYTAFDLAYWENLLPEGYAELLEVTHKFRAEAEEECRLEACVEETVQAEEFTAEHAETNQQNAAIDYAQQATQAQTQHVAQERRRSLADQLRAQVTQEAVLAEAPDAGLPPVTAAPTRDGIYYNTASIPLERYVLVQDGVVQRRRPALHVINAYIIDNDWEDTKFNMIYDYHNPTTVVQTNEEEF
jgi:hypothetical protein